MKKLPLRINDAFGTIKAPLETNYKPNTLSVAMIIRNEEKWIESALNSFLPIADEIIINDTGSIDNTLNILKGFRSEPKIHWFQSEWENDFSKARNDAISRCSCSWIMWLDADDFIPSSEYDKIRSLKHTALFSCFSFTVKNVEKNLPVAGQFLQTRMFPNHPEMRFERKVHEQIILAAARLGLYSWPVDVIIEHRGYDSDEIRKAKQRRNIELMKTIPDWESDYNLLNSMGNAYYVLNDWDAGIEYYKKAWAIPDLRIINEDAWAALPCRIGSGYVAKKNYAEALRWFNEGLRIFPDNYEQSFQIGFCLQQLGELKEAVKQYYITLAMPRIISSQSFRYERVRLLVFTQLLDMLKSGSEYEKLLAIKEKEFPGIKLKND